MTRHRMLNATLFFSALYMLVGCGSDAQSGRESGANDAGSVDAGSGATDGGAPSLADASSVLDAAVDVGVGVGDASAASCDASSCASLVGHVVRKATTKPQHGGIGNVYVAVFDGNPITDMAHARVVGRVIVADADLSSDTASVAYRVDGIPARATEYQVIAFLDDDHDATAQSPAPNKGDLASIDLAGFGGIKIVIAGAGDTSLDLPLNAALP
jgi:hypothetical protein